MKAASSTVLLVIFLLAACSTSGAASPSPSPSEATPTSAPPSASATASASPTEVPVVLPPTIMARTQVARVITDRLPVYIADAQGQLHYGPGGTVGAELVRGDLVYVTGMAVAVNGGAWYPIAYGFDAWQSLDQEGLAFGVVSAGAAGIDYFAGEPVECPADRAAPAFETVREMEPWERWSCFVGQELTLTAVVDTPCCNPPDGYVHEPDWLAKAIPGVLGSLNEGTGVIPFHIDPASGLAPPARGQVVTMRGHFSDPAALTCTGVPETFDEAPPELVPLAQVVACQMEFVVTGYEVVGSQSMPPCC